MSDQHLDFMVRRDDLSQVRCAESQTQRDQPLEPGDALLRVDRFALTSNNITYALVGELMRYWDFFPAPDGWGRIPVWGYADVVASRAPGLSEGERIYGYLPMSPYLRVRPERITEQSFDDASEHRRQLPIVYQWYVRAQRSDALSEDLRSLLQPLCGTAFLIDDWLNDQALFGAKQVVIASASSKTALATAFLLSLRPQRGFEVIGLTSPRNRGFCERVGYYDRVVEYADVASLPPSVPTLLIDMAGDLAVRRQVHTHFGTALRHSSSVGLTHRELAALLGAEPDLPGPAPELFFAPTHVEVREKTWGPEVFAERVREAENKFFESARGWMEIVHGRGMPAIEAAYRSVLDGRAQPHQGLILSV
jgi:hypothetical protein